jgi:hypothetical protein
MAGGLIRAFQDNGSGGWMECDTELYESSEKAAVATINRQVYALVTKTGSFTLELTEAGAYIRTTSISATTGTVPPSSSVNFPSGTIITFRQAGAGKITAMAGVGVTLNGDVNTAGQNKSLQIIKVGNDAWDVVGGVV